MHDGPEPPCTPAPHRAEVACLGQGLTCCSPNSCRSLDLASRDLPAELLQFNFGKYLLAVNTRADALGGELRKCGQSCLQNMDDLVGIQSVSTEERGEHEQSLGLQSPGLPLAPNPVACGFRGLGHAA